ncbi:MAG: hypothetical protein LUH10_15570 [Tannerellaceae bacterium]|nr:hypothetical protein [Tannerellaceae bacterium]
MYKVGENLITKVMINNTEVKKIYHGEIPIYPNVTGQKEGREETEWIYNLPKRTRIVTPWTQDEYGDGSFGEIIYGTSFQEEETADISESYDMWEYSITADIGTRTRRVFTLYEFSDIIKQTEKIPETESGIRNIGDWEYNWTTEVRTTTITYTFKDGVKQNFSIQENGHVSYAYTINPNATTIAAGGGTITVSSTSNIQKKWEGTTITTISTVIQSLKTISTSVGITVNGLSISAANRTTTTGDERSVIICGITNIDGKSIESTHVTITQNANRGTLQGSFSMQGRAIDQSPLPVYATGGYDDYTIHPSLYVDYTSGSKETTINLTVCNITTSIPNDPSQWLKAYIVNPDQIRIEYARNDTNTTRVLPINITIKHTNSMIQGQATKTLYIQQSTSYY